jgi:hypothetical protein
VENQADEVAEAADEAADAAAELDRTVRKSGAAQQESGKKSRDADEAIDEGSKAAADAELSDRSKASRSSKGSGSAQDTQDSPSVTPSVFDPSGRYDSAEADAGGPSVEMPPGGRRSDMTVPKAAVPLPAESRPGGNGRTDMPTRPLGSSAPDSVFMQSGEPSARRLEAEPTTEEESTASLAAASMARELTGAGFPRPGFASSARSGTGSSSTARTPAPGAKPATPSTAETNPAWRSPASAQKDTVSAASETVSAPVAPGPTAAPARSPSAASDAVASPPSRPAAASGQTAAPPAHVSPASSQAPTVRDQVTPAQRDAAWAQGQAAPEQSAWSSLLSPPTWSPSKPAATSQGPQAPISPAAQSLSAPPAQGSYAPPAPADPAYSPTGSPGESGSPGPMGVGTASATQTQDRLSAPQPPVAPVPSESTKDRLVSALTRPGSTKKKKRKPSAIRKPGGAIGSGRPTVTVAGRPGTLRQPTVQPAPRTARPAAAEVRDAQLVLTRVDPFSVLRFSFLVSLVGWVVLVVAVSVLYFTFSSLGVFTAIERTVHLVTVSKGHSGTNAASWFSAGTVIGYTMAAGVIDVILVVALSTIGAAVYNLVARVTGGVEVTLQEAD